MPDLKEQLNALRARLDDCLVKDRLRLGAQLDRLWPPRKPEAVAAQLDKIDQGIERSKAQRAKRQQALPSPTFPEDLPITARREEIVRLIRENPVVVIAGETGSGKTTQLPKMCLEAGFGAAGRIACTQPRRVAALSVARRIAEELKVSFGQEVGAKIRFQDKTSRDTVIKMMTDGMLLSEIQNDRELSEYDCVIVDEAHERSLNIDFLLGYLNLLRQRRPDLRILITSATIDTQAFSKAFGDAPIVEVSGRMYPVEVRYAPLDEAAQDSGDMTYIEAAALAAEDLIAENRPGDMLVFLPGERDIRDLHKTLDGRLRGVEILPLFGRLSANDQQRIFAPSQRRKIILATNIAETSITVPGIRYVIDTGLARLSRYNAQTHTRSLPIEPISRSSADQRKGRCGRVAEGICVRLYDEKDYESRPRFTAPEIQRANLADVILTMMAFGLGDIESFPFVDPPQERAIRAGHNLLRDLGAIDEEGQLTEIGKKLAQLPVDPTVGRILLQARQEGSLREVLVIASGLSIQDPRERPMEKQEAADTAHRRFHNERSDFLSLLNIWETFHEQDEKLSQGQLRKFCKAQFLNYLRMREWRDIHAQLEQVMDELGELHRAKGKAEYHVIHRAILAGQLANVAQREAGNHYNATHNRKVMLFPGSALFDKKAAKAERKKHKGKQQASTVSGNRTPPWIVCGEWVETNRLYARTAAEIDPRWISELAAHILKKSYVDPGWSGKSGRVLVRERSFLYGLEVQSRRVGYSKINPVEATEIFIRNGLVEDEVRENFTFLEHNRKLRHRIEQIQTRLRNTSSWALDDRVYDFYAQRIQQVGGVAELNRFIRDHHNGDDSFLHMEERDLLGGEGPDMDVSAFPEQVIAGSATLDINYAYKPGQEDDGATLRVPIEHFDQLNANLLDWAIPGYVADRVEALLRSLPRATRQRLLPIPDKAREIAQHLKPSPTPLPKLVAEQLFKLYDIRAYPDEWNVEAVPEWLKPRVEVVDKEGRPIAAARDWNELQAAIDERVAVENRSDSGAERQQLWRQACEKYERHGLTDWTFGDLPEELRIGDVASVPLLAWPGLLREKGSVSLQLFKERKEALRNTRPAFRFLVELKLGREFAWLEKELNKEMERVKVLTSNFAPLGSLKEQAWKNLLGYLIPTQKVLPLTEERFGEGVRLAKERARGLVPRFVDLVEGLLSLRQDALLSGHSYPGMSAELNALLPGDVLKRVPYEQLQHIPRYMKAMLKRADRHRIDPQKDAVKAKRVTPYMKRLTHAMSDTKKMQAHGSKLVRTRWMLEEFKVSVYAQELGTAEKVSEKKIEEALKEAEA